MLKRSLIILGVCATVGLVAVQFTETRRLRAELEVVRQQLGAEAIKPNETPAPLRSETAPAVAGAGIGNLPSRVAVLEHTVAQLSKASEYLMDRGQLPLATNKIRDFVATLTDPGTTDRDRLQALRMLRRNQALSDEVVQYAADWMLRATNASLREDLAEQFEGTTNALARDSLIKLAATDADPDVREQAVDSLRRFTGDPQVEAMLWNLLRDPDGGVREEAEEALREAPVNNTRAAALRARALDPQSSLDERLVAVRALQNSKDGAPDVMAALAQMAQTTQDSGERAKLFRVFDGTSEPNMKLPLVYGLQDANPIVRQEAADALSGFKSDPVIVDWLKHIAETDADPRVRREAFQALQDRR